MGPPFKPMTPQTTKRLRSWLLTIGALLPALGWVKSVADSRYVRREEYQRIVLDDSIMNAKLDSLNERVKQIQCGNKVMEGCR